MTTLIRKREQVPKYEYQGMSTRSAIKGLVSVGALLGGAGFEHVLAEDVVLASEYTEETALAVTDEIVMESVVSEQTEPDIGVAVDPIAEQEGKVVEVTEDLIPVKEEAADEEEVVPLVRDTAQLEEVIKSIKSALSALVEPGEHADSQSYKAYLDARSRLEEHLQQAEKLLEDTTSSQDDIDKAVLEYGQEAIELTRLAEVFRSYVVREGSSVRKLTNDQVVTWGSVSLTFPQTVEPMGLSGGQLRASLQFSINDLATAGDQFTVKLSPTLNLSGSGMPADVKIPNIVVDGKIIATGTWDHESRTILYTLNSNVNTLSSVTGSINLSIFVDQKVVQSEGRQEFTVTLNDQYQASRSSTVLYSNPTSRADGSYSIRAFLTNLNLTEGTYDHVIYLNENGKNNYGTNEILQIVSNGASYFSDAVTTIRAYRVPVGQFIDSMEGDFSKYTEITSRITSRFAANGQWLRLNLGSQTGSPLLLVISSRVDTNSTMNLSTETTYANSAMNTGAVWTNTNYMFSNAAIARGEYNSTSFSESISESVRESVSESTSESVRHSVSESASESVRHSVSESTSESVRHSVSESTSESVRESISESTSESIRHSVSE
ncbi:TPA: Ig-like domain-containing protein, partial [Streptococcus suis]